MNNVTAIIEHVQEGLHDGWLKMQNVTADDLRELSEKPEVVSEAIIVLIAVVTICIGSRWSVPKRIRCMAAGKPVDETAKSEEEEDVQVSHREALMFPFVGSAALLSLYICYKLFPKEMFNTVLSFYFVVVSSYGVSAGIYAMTHSSWLSGGLAIALGAGWWFTKHFLTSNAIAIMLCITSLWKIKLPTFTIGWILLWGLFIYDIWWVFGTEVMVSVARNIEAPVLLKIPKNLFAEEYKAKEMMMLGLGDIVIPGFYMATCLRFDYARAITRLQAGKRKGSDSVCTLLFTTSLVCYTLGLVNTILVMFLFEHAQPALLYLVPWLTFGTLIASILSGSVFDMFAYSEDPPPTPEEEEDLPFKDYLYNVVIADLFNLERVKGKKKDAEKKNQ